MKYSLSILGAFLLLWVSFKGVDWKMFWQGLKSCNWTFVIVSMLLGVLSFWFRGLRWRQLLLSVDPSTKRIACFNAVNICYVANMVLPRAGEFIACAYIHRHSALGKNGKKLGTYDKVFGTGLVDRIWDIISMSLFLIALLVLSRDVFGSFFFDKMFRPITEKLNFSVSGFVVMLILFVVGLIVAFVWASVHFRKQSKFFGTIYNVGKGILVGMRDCFLAKNWWLTFLHSMAVWACYWLACYAILLSMQGVDPAAFPQEMRGGLSALLDLNMLDALFLMIVGAISTVVPVPGGFGAYHYLVSLSLSVVYGIPVEIGIIFATLSHESQTLVQILCGGINYGYETVFKSRRQEKMIKA